MACRTVMRSVVLLSPCHHLAASPSILSCPRRSRVRVFHSSVPLRCSSNGDNTPPSSSSFQLEGDQSPPQEVVLKAISEVSKTEGRVAQTTNVIIGGTVTDDATNEWLELDKKVCNICGNPVFSGISETRMRLVLLLNKKMKTTKKNDLMWN